MILTADDRRELMAQMRRLALEAGAAILAIYHSGEDGARLKEDASPVTLADEAADRIISAGLRAAYPQIALVTEEQTASHAQSPERFFIVDPLDGTKEFIRRRGDFTVNIAYVEAGVPHLGIVYAPARERLFYTLPDGGAVEELGPFGPAPGALRPLQVATANEAALRVVASQSHRDAATDAYIAKYTLADVKSAGSSLKFCLVAAGEADLYPRCGRTMEWDTAAGDAILRAAGGIMVDMTDLKPFRYGKPGWENGFFIAAGRGISLHPG